MPGVRQLRGTEIKNVASPEIYCHVFDQLERDDVRHVVIGGVAVILHGHVRPVADLDPAIDPAPDEANNALHALSRAGFVPSLPPPPGMLSVPRMFDPSRREVDVFLRYHIPFNDLWAGSERKRVGDSVARVMSREHLLRTTQIDSRPHDLPDIEALLALEVGGGARG